MSDWINAAVGDALIESLSETRIGEYHGSTPLPTKEAYVVWTDSSAEIIFTGHKFDVYGDWASR
ncbi:MAG: hypothetical protein HYU02_05305 [Thaumarchaeota archaeon]|nr:hypothetical protein [Nitrososphaerota archaeon]